MPTAVSLIIGEGPGALTPSYICEAPAGYQENLLV